MIKLFKRYSHVNWALSDQAMVSGVNFFTGLLLARLLGLNEFGHFTLLWMIVLFVCSIQFSLISAPMMTGGPQQSIDNRKEYYSSIIIQQLVFSIISSLLVWLIMEIVDSIFPELQLEEFSILLALTVFFCQNQDFFRRLYFSKERQHVAFLIDAIRYLGLAFVLVLLFFSPVLSTEKVFWLMSITSALSVVVSVFFLPELVWNRKIVVSVFYKNWKFSKWMTASALLQWLTGHFFVVMSGALLGAYAAGAIKACQNIVGITNIIVQGMENFVPRLVSVSYKSKGIKGLLSTVQSINILGGVSIGGLLLVLAIFSEPILVLLYGNEYSSYGYLIYWLALFNFFGFLATPMCAGLRVLEKTKIIFFAFLACAIFSFLFAYVLINSHGLLGAVIGFVLTKIIFIGIVLFGFIREIKLEKLKEGVKN